MHVHANNNTGEVREHIKTQHAGLVTDALDSSPDENTKT